MERSAAGGQGLGIMDQGLGIGQKRSVVCRFAIENIRASIVILVSNFELALRARRLLGIRTGESTELPGMPLTRF